MSKVNEQASFTSISNLPGEVWRDVHDEEGNYIGLYQVSNLGRVKSLSRKVYNGDGTLNRTMRERIMRERSDKSTKFYHRVTLHGKNGLKRDKPVHRLVALEFASNTDPDVYVEVNHKDRDIHNNDAGNLEWVTPYENREHEKETQILFENSNRTEKNLNVNKSKKRTISMYGSADYSYSNPIHTFKSAAEAKRFLASDMNITVSVEGIQRAARKGTDQVRSAGYRWKWNQDSYYLK